MKAKTFTTTRDIKTKTGEKFIAKGSKVDVAFDVASAHGGMCATAFSMTTGEGVRIVSRDFSAIGIKVPSMRKLTKWNDEGVCQTVFGARVEPDGTDEYGAPSWLLAMGLI